MVMDNKNTMGIFILVFVAIVIGVVLLGSIADTSSDMTTIRTVSNESFTGVNGTLVALSNANLNAVTAVRNSTFDAQTVNVDYTVTTGASGGITIINGVAGTYYADYSYKPVGYVEDTTTRSIIPLIVIFGALAIMAAGVALAVGGLRSAGLV